ncbi:hypothetical protein GGR53DRAFT_508109 [Hypoxylon sp. FL1150]|nr:hypothetical protein GGR53DRAFT_508109 [Hypoxylon sp. FL1150]
MVLTRSSTVAAEARKRLDRKTALARRKTASTHPQRSSMRRALQISLRDAATSLARPPAPARYPDATANGWHRIRAIVAEACAPDGQVSYLVDWEGRDPRSGMPWPNSWVIARNVTRFAKRKWEQSQKDKDKDKL